MCQFFCIRQMVVMNDLSHGIKVRISHYLLEVCSFWAHECQFKVLQTQYFLHLSDTSVTDRQCIIDLPIFPQHLYNVEAQCVFHI